ncbi:MAG: hypothetical protein GJ676_01215 [Rhodobacteraceae bacterium]|nr:hypothetical protein [Paracoccaceae bacterium]
MASDIAFDIILTGDPSTYRCLSDEGHTIQQMWDKHVGPELDLNIFQFKAHFSDGPTTYVFLNPEFETEDAAGEKALRYTRALGQLLPDFRQGLRQVSVHKGKPTSSAGSGKIFVYSDRTTIRIKENHLRESRLHESVHASLDRQYRLSGEWITAQGGNDALVTRHAASRPERKDQAETALFALAIMYQPDRIPPVDTRMAKKMMPTRLTVSDRIFSNPVTLPIHSEPPDRRH